VRIFFDLGAAIIKPAIIIIEKTRVYARIIKRRRSGGLCIASPFRATLWHGLGTVLGAACMPQNAAECRAVRACAPLRRFSFLPLRCCRLALRPLGSLLD
jgi:hypothetical protein